TALDVEVAVVIAVAAILGVEPRALSSDGDLAGLHGRQLLAGFADDGHLETWDGFAKGTGLDGVAVETRVVHDEDADLGRAVHAAWDDAEGLLCPAHGRAIHRLAGVGELPEVDPVLLPETGIAKHPEYRWRRRDVGDAEVLERFEDPHGV